jgi:hypothetical protein
MNRFEKKDIEFRPLMKILGGIVVAALGVHGISALLVALGKPPWHAWHIAPEAVHTVPPEPRLQSNPQADLEKMREEEQRELQRYAWIDRTQGVVQIPIDHAVDILARRGLPARSVPSPRRTP